ncbi:hypothetical protein A0J61_08240 [Choanephora cucurbitarum]|uniref:Uncharacterized protein n=1 Tax=Choanephora cucurbitarum TaxID=101091 RepID=A0A1C7N3U9_9FUNG|nr:hypothetical protein A0J61_08240 [Choanephora cucurbitarum]
MWSPSPSLVVLNNYTMASEPTCGSRLYYHHDPMLYHETSYCMICGLAHSVPHTAMKDDNQKQDYQTTEPHKPIITPAPIIVLYQQSQSPHHRQFDAMFSHKTTFSLSDIKKLLFKMVHDFTQILKKKASFAINKKSSLIYPAMIKRHYRSRLEKHLT